MTDETNTSVANTTTVQSEAPTEQTVAAPSSAAQSSPVDFQSIMNELPDDLKSDPSLSNVKDTTTLVKNYINAQKMIGNSIRIPRQDDPQELKDAFYNKLKDVPGLVKLPTTGDKAGMDALYAALGRPMTSDGYKIEPPQGATVDEGISKAFKGLAHNIGLNQAQAKALADFQFGLAQQEYAKNVAEVNQTKEILAQEWGKDYDNRINAVKELIGTYAAKFPDQAAALNDNRVMNNPVVLMMAAELAKSYKEKGLISGGNSVKFGLTPDEAREKIIEVRGNPELFKAYTDDRHPNHKAIVEKMQQYYNAASS